MGEVNVESHNMGPAFCRLASLSILVNQPPHSWDTTLQRYGFRKSGSRPPARTDRDDNTPSPRMGKRLIEGIHSFWTDSPQNLDGNHYMG